MFINEGNVRVRFHDLIEFNLYISINHSVIFEVDKYFNEELEILEQLPNRRNGP